MIETELGFRVAAMYLGQVHPSLARAKLIQVPPMAEELELIVEDQILRGEAMSGALPDATFALPLPKSCAPNALACARMRQHPMSVAWLLSVSLSYATRLA